MIDEAVRAEMRRLVLGEGWKICTVARRFSVHHTVVRRAVLDRPLDKARVAQASALEPHKAYIVERLEKFPQLTAARLMLELRDRGYVLGIAILRRYIAKVRGPRERKAYLRVEVGPGEQAQVDWGSFGWMRIGNTQRPLSCFVMVLSWSRALFFDFALDQRMETFCALHQRAFEFFGGVPQKLLVASRERSASFDTHSFTVDHSMGSPICVPRPPSGVMRSPMLEYTPLLASVQQTVYWLSALACVRCPRIRRLSICSCQLSFPNRPVSDWTPTATQSLRR